MVRPSNRSRARRRRRQRILKSERLENRELLAADVRLNEFLASNDQGLFDGNGNQPDWIELTNVGDQLADLAGWHLTDDATNLNKWTFPDVAASDLMPGDFLVVFASGDGTPDLAGNLHTNFELSASGEYLALVDPLLNIVSEFGTGQSDYPPQRTDISYGIDSTQNTRYMLTPTPGSANGIGFEGFVKDTTFSVDRGYFVSAFDVVIASDTVDATIIYTTDGSEPTLTNGTQVASSPGLTPSATVPIATTTTLRAAAFKTDFLETNVDTQTYLFLADVGSQSNTPPGFPTTWGSAPAADYEMDPEIVTSYGQELIDALGDLPALSIATDVDGLFGGGGIYSNPNNSNLEIPVSAEYILTDGSTGFQIDAGLKIAGGASRNPNNSPKHSMSLRFRNEYGASRLEYEMFEGSPVTSFNSLQLRAMYNNSWIHWDNGQRSRGTLIRDQFIRDSLIAAGQDDAGRGSYAHLFLNGLYWGVYNVHERHDAAHYAEYHGGNSEDYDALNGGAPIDGNITSWNQLKTIVQGGDWNAIQQVLDVDNFIDWSIAMAFGGNADLKTNGNWRAAGGGPAGGLWRMYSWDAERIFEGLTAKPPSTITDATGMFNDLVQVPEFVVRFGDRIQEHFFADGALTPEKVIQRWEQRVDELSKAMVAESARWGDYRRDVHPRGATPSLYERDVHWNNENTRLINDYLPFRSDFVVFQYINDGLMPSVPAPRFSVDGTFQDGGQVIAGSELRLISNEASVFYTTDGSDPRQVGGAAHPGATEYQPNVTATTLLAADSVWKYHDLGIDLGQAWREPSFDDSSWSAGNAELGFGEGDEATVVSFGGDPSMKHRTTYFRSQFNASANDFTALTLRLRRDDGAVVYLNGQEIVRDNMPSGSITYSTAALQAAPDDGNTWLLFDVPSELIQLGNNTLAVEIHQNSNTSSDLSFNAELIATEQTETPIVLNDSLSIRARTRAADGTWSAITDSLFLVPHVPASAVNLRITEIHFNPRDDGDAEFIELQNITSGATSETIDLDSLQLTDGPSSPFVFPLGTSLGPGQVALLVRDQTAFTATYPTVDSNLIVGQYVGKLSNGGERVRLLDATGQKIVDINYEDNDPWPRWPDGFGGSLELIAPAATPSGQSGKPHRWRGSAAPNGTPGNVPVAPAGVVINEVLAHTDQPLVDSIELFNTTTQDIHIGGWYLSDDGENPFKFQIPAATILAAGGTVVFNEDDFNPQPTTPNNFALNSSEGDEVWLTQGDGTNITQFVDQVSFGATFNGVSIGRVADGNRLVPLAAPSLGEINGMFAISDIVLSEINYHPGDPSSAALAIDPSLTDNDLEFVEIYNRLDSSTDLTNWRVRGDADFDFVAATQLGGKGSLVIVGFDPEVAANATRLAAFRTHYGIDASVSIVGPFTGGLGNGFGLVKLQAPDSPPAETPTLIPRVVVDEVLYDDFAPWPTATDGNGPSLQRISPSTLGTYSGSWIAHTPSPGNSPAGPEVESIVINGGSATRSTVTRIDVQFDGQVDVSENSFTLVNTTTGEEVTGLQVTPTLVDGKTLATLSFIAGPSVISGTEPTLANTLADGDYQLTIHATMITSQSSGFAMTADTTDSFFRDYGDQDGNGAVNLFDFAAFRNAFSRILGDPLYREDFDSNRDGVINLFDFATFRGGWG